VYQVTLSWNDIVPVAPAVWRSLSAAVLFRAPPPHTHTPPQPPKVSLCAVKAALWQQQQLPSSSSTAAATAAASIAQTAASTSRITAQLSSSLGSSLGAGGSRNTGGSKTHREGE